MRKDKTVTRVFDQFGEDWPPEEAAGALRWFQMKLNIVPPEYRDTARIGIDGDENYGSVKATITFSHVRPETDEEVSTREAEERQRADRVREHELRTLAELRSRYPNTN